MTNLPAPRSNNEFRAPKTATLRGCRGVPAASPQSTTYARLGMGEKRGVQSGATLIYILTEASLKASPVVSILATEAQAPSPRIVSLRERKRKPAAPDMSLIPNTSQHL